MDNDSVAMFLPEETERNRRRCKPGRRFFCILALVAFFTLTILFSVVLSFSVMNTNKYESLKEQYVGNDKLETLIDSKINDSEFARKRDVDARLASIDRNLLNHVQADEIQRSQVNNSFENITNDVENLISSVDRLTTRLLRVNSSSARKMLHLRNTLTGIIKDDLNQTRASLTKVNESLRNDLSQIDNSLRADVKNLRGRLNKLVGSTTAENNELNETISEFKLALENLAHHNTNIHLTMNDRTSMFNSKIDMVKRQLELLGKNTTIFRKKYLQDVEIMLNKTRRSLEGTFRKSISKTDTNMSERMNNSETQLIELKSLLLKVTTKVDNVKNQLETNMTDMMERQTNISALAVKIKSITDALNTEKRERLKLKKELEKLRLANADAEILKMNTSLILVFLVSMLIYF